MMWCDFGSKDLSEAEVFSPTAVNQALSPFLYLSVFLQLSRLGSKVEMDIR